MWCSYGSDDDDDLKEDLNDEENVNIEELVPNVGTHDCEEDDSDFQPIVELHSEIRDNTELKSSDNGPSYKKLLEEAENEIIISNDVNIVIPNAREFKLSFKDKLKGVRDHVYSSLQVFISILKYEKVYWLSPTVILDWFSLYTYVGTK